MTGNVFWKPLPHVVGTASFYQDSTLGLANAVNPNPERFGPYISSTDEDESEDWSDEDTTSESSTSESSSCLPLKRKKARKKTGRGFRQR